IRDFHVTGVQTCALPISSSVRQDSDRVVNGRAGFEDNVVVQDAELVSSHEPYFYRPGRAVRDPFAINVPEVLPEPRGPFRQVLEIGRASCRERAEIAEVW